MCLYKHLTSVRTCLVFFPPFCEEESYKNISQFKYHSAGNVTLCSGQQFNEHALHFHDNVSRNRNNGNFTLCTMDCTDKDLEDFRLARLAELLRYFISVKS